MRVKLTNKILRILKESTEKEINKMHIILQTELARLINYTVLRGSVTKMTGDEFKKNFDAENEYVCRNCLARQVLE